MYIGYSSRKTALLNNKFPRWWNVKYRIYLRTFPDAPSICVWMVPGTVDPMEN